MDYEKKYNEALERAKKIHDEIVNNEVIGFPEQITDIFPELRESEDERMMREFNDWLCEEIECRTNDLRDEKDRRTLNMLCYVLTNVKDWLEKQKEPTTEELYAEAGTTEKEYIANTMKMVRAMRERKKEQKPISQEDFDTAKHEALWDEQKPAWSEEDEKMIDTIVSVLGQYIDYKAVSGTGTGYATPRYSKEIAWLKSIRPSWKPSEEQMEALLWCIAHLGGADRRVLAELYEHLKMYCK